MVEVVNGYTIIVRSILLPDGEPPS